MYKRGSATYTSSLIKKITNLVARNKSPHKTRKSRGEECNFIKVIRESIINEVDEQTILDFFKIPVAKRKQREIKKISDYLSLNQKNKFFWDLRDINKDQLYKLVSALNIEYIEDGKKLLQYNENCDKFYIILKGKISLYMPYFAKKKTNLDDFVNYLLKIKNKDPKSFMRIQKKNETVFEKIMLNLKLNEYNLSTFTPNERKQINEFYIEDVKNVHDIPEGSQVNQFALLYNLKNSFYYFTKGNVILLSITKSEFYQILKNCLEEDLTKHFAKIRKYCYIFNAWGNNNLAQIFNISIPTKILHNEILYSQDSDADSFYLIEDGIFDLYCELSVSEMKQYIKYINNDSENLIHWIKEKSFLVNGVTAEKIMDQIAQGAVRVGEAPRIVVDRSYNNIKYINHKTIENLDENNKESIINLKINEDLLQNKDKKIKIKIGTLYKNDFIGIEDSLELKKRFYTVECSSENGTLSKIPVDSFALLINKNISLHLSHITKYIKEKKKFLIDRINLVINNEINNNKIMVNYTFNKAFIKQGKRFEKKPDQRQFLKIKTKKNSINNNLILNNLFNKNTASGMKIYNDLVRKNKAINEKLTNIDSKNNGSTNTLSNNKFSTLSDYSRSKAFSSNSKTNYRPPSRYELLIKKVVPFKSINDRPKTATIKKTSDDLKQTNNFNKPLLKLKNINKQIETFTGIYNTKRAVSKKNKQLSKNRIFPVFSTLSNLRSNTKPNEELRVSNLVLSDYAFGEKTHKKYRMSSRLLSASQPKIPTKKRLKTKI